MRACRWQAWSPGPVSPWLAGRRCPPLTAAVCGFAPGHATPFVMAFRLGPGRGGPRLAGACARQVLAGVSGAPAARAAA